MGNWISEVQRNRMSLRKTLFGVCLLVSVICLAAGYGISGGWIGVVAAIITAPAWLLARKFPDSGLPFICLLLSICLAVVGILNNAPSMMMICGGGFALAAWDLVFLDYALKSTSSDENTSLYEKNHIQSLALALVSGLLIVFVGRYLRLETPFILMLAFIGLVLFGCVRVWGYIKKPHNS
jgi:hypothetical protein